MKTLEEIAIEHGLCTCSDAYTSRNLQAPDCPLHAFAVSEAMEAYAGQFRQKWIPVSEVMPPFNTIVLLRGVISWRSKNSISYFSDELENDYEILEYGLSGYLLKEHNDYLVVNHPNPEEVCSEYITHWQPLPAAPERKEVGE